ncbi:MAG: enolase C-terminal domain-like protein [Thermomicrobiales bacterium]
MTGTDLSSHRIAAIERADLPSHYPRTVGKNARLGSHGDGPTAQYATIRTDQGATGWGLVRSGAADHDRDLIGAAVADLFAPETGVTDERADTLDFALHDLAGIILNQPVYQMIGTAGRTTVPCYDGAIYMDDLDPENAPRGIDVVLENCTNDYQLGFRAFKLKIGRGYRWMTRKDGLQRDIDVTRAVHAQFPDCRVLVDANNGYDYSVDEFLTYLDGVQDCDLFWIEEPFEENRPGLTRLRSYLNERGAKTLLADGETSPDIPLLIGLAQDSLLDVLIMDIVSFGLTNWRHLMPTLQEIGVAASPHTWGFPIKTLYAAQLAAGAGNVVTIEGIPGHTQGVDTSGYPLANGNLHVPDRPGFGLNPPQAG